VDAAVAARRPLPPPRVRDAAATAPNASIVEREDVSPSIARFRVRPDDGVPAFRPGQYLALGIDIGGRPLQRPYSTASAPGEPDVLEFLVRLVPHGELTPRLWALREGSRVRLGRPKGLFVPGADDDRRAVYVATGTGIAPLLSMLVHGLPDTDAAPATRRPVVVHGVALPRDLAYRDRLEALHRDGRIRYVPAVTRPADLLAAGWTGAIGRVDGLLPGILAEAGARPDATVAFICGNPGMTDAASAALRAWGLADEAVRSEAYWTSGAGGSADTAVEPAA
jgi:ferredoxin--NADP+ reductase